MGASLEGLTCPQNSLNNLSVNPFSLRFADGLVTYFVRPVSSHGRMRETLSSRISSCASALWREAPEVALHSSLDWEDPISTFVQDVRFALRQVRQAPGFVLTAVLTLSLGVGANTAVYSLLDQALLRVLPVRAPEQLVVLSAPGKAWQGHTGDRGAGADKSFSYPMYRDLRDRAKVFDGLIATSPASVAITHDRTSEVGQVELVSGNYFSVLGCGACSRTVAHTCRRWSTRRKSGCRVESPLLDCADGRGPAYGGRDDRPERTYFRGDRHCAAKLPERGVGRDAGVYLCPCRCSM